VPPGLKLVRVNLKSGLRATANDPQAIQESFKPNEEPDDAYSIIGFQVSDTAAPGAAPAPGGGGDAYTPSGGGWAPTETPPGNAPPPARRQPPASVW
jgi:penicillin-binding protein 1A